MGMNIFLGGIALLGVASATSVFAQDGSERLVEQYACKDILRENGSNREVAIAFLHGFILGKTGSSKFNIEAMTKQTDAFLERCLDNPHDKAIDAMMKVKS
jgi:hypothetical protein